MIELNRTGKLMWTISILERILGYEKLINIEINTVQREMLNVLVEYLRGRVLDSITISDFKSAEAQHYDVTYSKREMIVIYKQCAEFLRTDPLLDIVQFTPELAEKLILNDVKLLSDYLAEIEEEPKC